VDVGYQEVVTNADSTILVGVSGSPASLAALRWAKGEAGRCGYRLKVVLVWQSDQRASYARQAARSDGTDRPEQALCAVAPSSHRARGTT
jgi:nucleotide-binding universal stress UspA family protein